MGNNEYEELQKQIAALTRRVYKLEQQAGIHETIAPIPPKPEFTTASASKSEVESKIGGQWLNRIGIVAVLVGVSYFLKYAFDNEWVGPASRVMLGLIAGVAIVIWSDFVRRSGYAVFSYSLKAIGIGVLYLCLWASSQVYGL